MNRHIAIALPLLALLVAPRSIHAQAPSASVSAAPVKEHAFRDFEKEPPTKLGTKLDPTGGWDKAARPALIRTHLPATNTGAHVGPERCEVLVKDDWLRVWCEGATGRVHQLAGDTADVVVHISNQMLKKKTAWDFDDKRRLALYVRLVPGHVTVVEATSILWSDYNGNDWEGPASLVTVDWSDTEKGPRIHLAQSTLGYRL